MVVEGNTVAMLPSYRVDVLVALDLSSESVSADAASLGLRGNGHGGSRGMAGGLGGLAGNGDVMSVTGRDRWCSFFLDDLPFQPEEHFRAVRSIRAARGADGGHGHGGNERGGNAGPSRQISGSRRSRKGGRGRMGAKARVAMIADDSGAEGGDVRGAGRGGEDGANERKVNGLVLGCRG